MRDALGVGKLYTARTWLYDNWTWLFRTWMSGQLTRQIQETMRNLPAETRSKLA